jgi:hypothetical protein
MRAKINIDTFGKINSFVSICSKFNCSIRLIDGTGYCVSAKSVIGAVATMDWTEVFVVSDEDIYSHIKEFVVE